MGQAVIEFDLPYPPSVNHYYRRVGLRTLISREGRRYRDRVCAILAGRGLRPMAGPVEVVIDIYPPDRRRRDLDNTQKSLFDSIQHAGVYGDDSQIAKITITRRDPVPGGRVSMAISEYRG